MNIPTFPGVQISTDPETCSVLSSDISAPSDHPASAILQPANLDDVIAIVSIARREGISLYPRGGGWSYTGGYRPGPGSCLLVDSKNLLGIAIDRDSGTVTAGAGTRWVDLHAALDAAGLRAQSFGPLSGFGATLGGAAAQNGGFFGTAGYGAFGDGTICGGTMVSGTADPITLHPTDRLSGSSAPQPLVGDCGAFGIRTAVTLRTMAKPPATGFASFHFADGAAALAVLAGLVDVPHLGEAYIFDPGSHANLARTGFSVIESATLAADLLKKSGGWRAGVSGLVRTVTAGKAFVADLAWSLHLSFDGTSAQILSAAAEVTRRAQHAGGETIPDIIPRVTRARPFRRIKALLGPDGESWLPVHGVFAPGEVQQALSSIHAELVNSSETMCAHQVRAVILISLMGTRIVIEPQLFWPDALTPVLRHMATPEQLVAYGNRPPNPSARQTAHALRHRLIETLDAAGATHFQIGRTYSQIPPEIRSGWQSLKKKFDPDGIINPGVLGL
jgi:FAD/FMN-containing dehydrogenase